MLTKRNFFYSFFTYKGKNMQNTSAQSRPALKQGILFGVIVGVILIVYLLLNYLVYNATLTLIVGIIAFLVELGLYAFAGYRASAITGKTGTGAIAGLFTGLFGGLIGAVTSIILLFLFVDTTRIRALSLATSAAIRQIYTNSFIITTGLLAALLGLALAIGYGAGLGAIGGLLGKRRAPQAQPYQEALYQGMPPTQGQYQGPYQGVPPMQHPYQQGPFQGMPPSQHPYPNVPPSAPNQPPSPSNYQ